MPRKPRVKGALGVFGAAMAGASVSYLFAPDAGRRRRALIRDKLVSAAHSTADALGVSSRDAAHRARGLVSGIRSRLVADAVTDDVVMGRVRAAIGVVVSRPGAVEVAVTEGRVTLGGFILAAELDRLIPRGAAVPGVRSVEHHLIVLEAPDRSGRPGSPPRSGAADLERAQRHWSSAAELLGGIVVGGLSLAGFPRRGVVGSVAGVTGLVFLARAMTNREVRRLARSTVEWLREHRRASAVGPK